MSSRGPLGPGAEKAQQRVENDNFSSFFSGFRLAFDSSSTFLGVFVEAFCKVIFRDPPKMPFKTSIKLTFPKLFLPRKVIFALQGKRLKITRKDS